MEEKGGEDQSFTLFMFMVIFSRYCFIASSGWGENVRTRHDARGWRVYRFTTARLPGGS